LRLERETQACSGGFLLGEAGEWRQRIEAFVVSGEPWDHM
jgi:hypothetical protein